MIRDIRNYETLDQALEIIAPLDQALVNVEYVILGSIVEGDDLGGLFRASPFGEEDGINELEVRSDFFLIRTPKLQFGHADSDIEARNFIESASSGTYWHADDLSLGPVNNWDPRWVTVTATATPSFNSNAPNCVDIGGRRAVEFDSSNSEALQGTLSDPPTGNWTHFAHVILNNSPGNSQFITTSTFDTANNNYGGIRTDSLGNFAGSARDSANNYILSSDTNVSGEFVIVVRYELGQMDIWINGKRQNISSTGTTPGDNFVYSAVSIGSLFRQGAHSNFFDGMIRRAGMFESTSQRDSEDFARRASEGWIRI